MHLMFMKYIIGNKRRGRAGLRRLMRDRRGTVALIFGLLALPLCLLIGTSVDIARIAEGNQVIQDALDIAAVAGATAYTDASQHDVAMQVAQRSFQNASFPSWVNPGQATVQIEAGLGTIGSTSTQSFNVTVTSSASLKLTFMAMLQGIVSSPMSFTRSATAGNPIVSSSLINKRFPDGAADWNSAFLYVIPRNADGTRDYMYRPTGSDLYEVDQNCVGSVRTITNTPTWNTDIDHITISYSLAPRCWGQNGAPNGMGGYIGYNVVEEMQFAANSPFGVAYQNMTAGNYASAEAYRSAYGSWPPDNVRNYDNPFGYTNQYRSPSGNVNWFYSGPESVSQPPTYYTDQLNSAGGLQTYYGGQASYAYRSSSIDSYYATPSGDNLSYPLAGIEQPWFAIRSAWPSPDESYDNVSYYWKQNCSLQLNVPDEVSHYYEPNGSASSPACYTPGSAASGAYHANDSCMQRDHKIYTYYFNDMGGLVFWKNPTPAYITGDDFNYSDFIFSLQCDAASSIGVILFK